MKLCGIQGVGKIPQHMLYIVTGDEYCHRL